MERLKKARGPKRAMFTRTVKEIQTEIKLDNPDIRKLKVEMKHLETVYQNIEALDNQIMETLLDDNASENDITLELELASKYHKEWLSICEDVKDLTDEESQSQAPATVLSADGSEHNKRRFKLPKIELPKFNGDLKCWLSWWSQFEKIDGDKSLDNSDKFQYLLQATESEARKIVSVLPATGENYAKAIKELKRRYGREGLQLQVYLRELLNLVITNVTKKDKIPLEDLYLQLESHLGALKTLDLSKAEPSMYFYPLVESSLPEEVLRTWLRNSTTKTEDDKKTKLENLMDFIKQEVEGEQQILLAQNGFLENKSKSFARTSRNNRDSPTSQSLFSGGTSTKGCVFCEKTNHYSSDCKKAIEMSLEEKNKKLQIKRACFKCFRMNHLSKDCRVPVKCMACGGNHYALMCKGQSKGQEKSISKPEEVSEAMQNLKMNETVSNACQTSEDGLVLMKTVYVQILDSHGRKKKARLLFDEGSNRSFVKTATAEKMKCKVVEEFTLRTTLFGGTKTISKPKKKFNVRLQSLNSQYQRDFQFINEDTICGDCPTIPAGPWMNELANQKIFVNDTSPGSPEIEILIGSNLWPSLVTGRMYKLKCGLIAVETYFGWTLSGEIPSSYDDRCMSSTVIAMLTQGEKSLPDLWELEAIGIKDSAEKLTADEHNEKVKQDFKKNIARSSDGRYVVKLPWIDENIPIPSNKSVCRKRLESTTRKLIQEDLFSTYDDIYKGWEAEGIIESLHAQTENGHFLPHRRVLKLDSKTTPVRPVFDASCKVGKNPSLNECLEQGPNMLELIPSILFRFREKDIGVISDIRKAFQMISVAEEDKNYQKFLWWENSKPEVIKEYKHCRVVFGLNCSPFILAAVLEHHLEQVQGNEEKAVVELLKKSVYVDNCVLSLDRVEEYEEFRRISVQILADAKMDLRQWESSSDNSAESTTVLGLTWNKREDTLQTKFRPEKLEEKAITKRVVLSIASQIYDPLGFTCPATLQAKLMLQSSWTKNSAWDEEWPEEDKKKFMKWYEGLDALEKIKIPRVAIGSFARKIQLHLFTDASKEAFAGVVYARVEVDGGIKVQLLTAKSRLAPLEKMKKSKKTPNQILQSRITINRLELMGCVIGARLLSSTVESLGYQNLKIICWSDSTTALAWIRRDEAWGTWVGNRVREINYLTKDFEWRHVPGEHNPADLPSRGCSPKELLESNWWEGPSWLSRDESEWPSSVDTPEEENVAKELKKTAVIATINVEKSEPRFSSYWKNARVFAWIRRFVFNARAGKAGQSLRKADLTKEEILIGEEDMLRGIQKRQFPDGKVDKSLYVQIKEDKLIHLRTRLTYKDDHQLFKSPIVLPSDEPLVHQLIHDTHVKNCHAGAQFVLNKLRERYWIVKGRATVNKVIRKCVICRRFSAKSLTCDPAPLPAQRVEATYCFENTGVDLAGPIILKGGKKAWIVIYTCAVYRGVYLDIVDSLSSEEFLNSLHKFTCIIGRPSTTYSDNGTNFVGAQTLMDKLNWKKIESKLNVQKINWKFNPPTAAWWGGFWERLIRTLKDLLKRMIGTARLTRKELETCLAEISQVMNNRPLTTLTENESDLIALTPAMFMRDLPITGLPELEMMTSKDLQDAHRKINDIKAALKARFRKEYVGNLIQRQAEKSTPNPRVGDVVLVGSDNRKRFEWPLGRILELLPGRDEKVRVAKIKTSRGILERPLQRLYPLEVSSPSYPLIEDEDFVRANRKSKGTKKNWCEDPIPNPEAKIITRSGRIIHKPCRYDSWNN